MSSFMFLSWRYTYICIAITWLLNAMPCTLNMICWHCQKQKGMVKTMEFEASVLYQHKKRLAHKQNPMTIDRPVTSRQQKPSLTGKGSHKILSDRYGFHIWWASWLQISGIVNNWTNRWRPTKPPIIANTWLNFLSLPEYM